jgi:hypothetical protein
MRGQVFSTRLVDQCTKNSVALTIKAKPRITTGSVHLAGPWVKM